MPNPSATVEYSDGVIVTETDNGTAEYTEYYVFYNGRKYRESGPISRGGDWGGDVLPSGTQQVFVQFLNATGGILHTQVSTVTVP